MCCPDRRTQVKTNLFQPNSSTAQKLPITSHLLVAASARHMLLFLKDSPDTARSVEPMNRLPNDQVIHWGLGASVLILFCIGFCIFGPQVLLVGTLPVDLARRGTAAAAAGFVNFMGYMGAAAGDKLTGHFAQVYGWQFAVRFWAGCAFAAAVVIVCLWNAGKQTKS